MGRCVGVLASCPAADGRLPLILPDGSVQLVEPRAADEELKARFGLDEVVHAPRIEFAAAVCLDGPLAGTSSYVVNRIGSRIRCSTREGPGPSATYEVVKLSGNGVPAELRFVP